MDLTIAELAQLVLAFEGVVLGIGLVTSWLPVVLAPPLTKLRYLRSAVVVTGFDVVIFAVLLGWLALLGLFTPAAASTLLQVDGRLAAFGLLGGVMVLVEVTLFLRFLRRWRRWRQALAHAQSRQP